MNADGSYEIPVKIRSSKENLVPPTPTTIPEVKQLDSRQMSATIRSEVLSNIEPGNFKILKIAHLKEVYVIIKLKSDDKCSKLLVCEANIEIRTTKQQLIRINLPELKFNPQLAIASSFDDIITVKLEII